ncbi:MAG: twin-arginine translocation signal domain-containing protein, partial [Verrucomicrobia bacterium]|nr:twin-arginine translocation signal domain-containing protein [Verrucomicrobiota bacterium]
MDVKPEHEPTSQEPSTMQTNCNRRDFLKTAAVGATTVA